MASQHEYGKKGEELAADMLRNKGYAILATNYRYERAEVDIIARKGATLVAVEVKLRSSIDFGNPQDFVNKKKIQLLVKAVHQYVESHDLDVDVRFDIVAIVKQNNTFDITHLEDAFYHF